MISLPVIFREFRVAARKRHTFVMRCVFGGFLLVMVLFFLSEQFRGMRAPAQGKQLLELFGWQLMALVFLFAPALSAGCISDEKSQGTLGLLFLTHLNSADIVLGKFVGRGVDLLLLVLSATPLLFVPILLGGVSWEQTLSVVASLSAMVVLALSVGVFCSTLCRQTGVAVIAAYGFLVAYNILAIGLPEMKRNFWWSQRTTLGYWFPDWMALASPAYALDRGVLEDSLTTLLCCAAVGALLVAVSVWRLPATIQAEMFAAPRWRFWAQRSNRRQARRNRSVLDRDPIVWLHFGRRSNRWILQAVIGAITCGWAAFAAWCWEDQEEAFVMMFLGGLACLFFLKMLVVIHAARILAAEKEDGALELLLLTPLSDNRIVRGKLQAILGHYGLLWIVIFGLSLTGALGVEDFSISDEEFLIGFYLFTTTISSLAWAVCLSAWISVRCQSSRQALTWAILTTVLLTWAINFGTIGGGFFLDRHLRLNDKAIWATVTILRIAVEVSIAALIYRSLVRNLRVYAARK